MASVNSDWASSPISIPGPFNPAEWSGAGIMPMPGGFLWVKNDPNFLYLAIDLVNDTGNSPGVGDYFWLSFDVDRSGSITSGHDVNYGIYPSLPVTLARQLYLGPGTWTGILGGPTTSAVQQAFGPSPHSAVPHRIWKLRIALPEVGLSSLGDLTLPVLRFGLRVSSSTPAITTNFPPNFYTNFSSLHEIYLATGPDAVYPPGTAGPVIAGVGLIPFTTISAAGRATTTAPYVPTVTNAAFGSTLNYIYNRPNITAAWGAGARKYKVFHRVGTSGTFVPLRRNWANYRWTGTTYVLESFGPDPQDYYALKDPALDYSTKDLLFQMATGGSAGAPPLTPGLHEWKVELYNNANAVVATPAQILRLFVDNTAPETRILDVQYDGASVAPCSIITIAESPAKPVRVRFRAFDPEGNLRGFGLAAYYGGPGTPPMNLLPAGMGAYPGGNWQGVADQWIDAPLAPVRFPPVSCAYQLRLSAAARTTNGYGYIGSSESTTHVTFLRPGVAPFATPKPLVAAFGFEADSENRVVKVRG